MGYTIKDLFESDKFPEMQLISGHSGINREIRGIRIIEVPDMERFLSGGERTSADNYESISEDKRAGVSDASGKAGKKADSRICCKKKSDDRTAEKAV